MLVEDVVALDVAGEPDWLLDPDQEAFCARPDELQYSRTDGVLRRLRSEPSWMSVRPERSSWRSFLRLVLTPEEKRRSVIHALGPAHRAMLGGQIFEQQPAKWSARFHGQYAAFTLDGRLLAVNVSLEGLLETLSLINPKEDYHVGRVGSPTIGTLR